MTPDSMATAVPAAIRRATQEQPAAGQGWTVRITMPHGAQEFRLASQRQVGRLAVELERLGFVLDAASRSDTDFVFALDGALSDA